MYSSANVFIMRSLLYALFIVSLLLHLLFLQEAAYARKHVTGVVDSLLLQLDKQKTKTGRVELLLALSRLQSYDVNQRIAHVEEALNLSRDIKYDKGIFEAFTALGDIQWFVTKNNLEALSWYEQCLDFAEAINNKEYLIRAHNFLGACYNSLGQYDKALFHYKYCLDMDSDKGRKIQVLGDVGNIYATLADYLKALESFQSAYRLLNEDMVSAKEIESSDTLVLMGLKYEIAKIYMLIPDYNKALENYKDIKQFNKNIRYVNMDISADMGIGDCYLKKKEYEEAIEYYLLANDLLTELNKGKSRASMPGMHISALNKLGDAYFTSGDHDKAIVNTEEALSLAKENNNIDLLPDIYVTLSKIYTAQKDFNRSEVYLRKAVEIARQQDDPGGESTAWQTLSKLYAQMKMPEKALDAYKNYISLRDSLFSRTKLQELTRIDMQGEFDRQLFRDSLKQAEEKAIVTYELQKQKIFTYSGFAGLILILLLSFFIYRNYTQQKKINTVINETNKTISEEKQVSENLLLNILPEEVADELKVAGNVQARQFDNVTVLFTDFINFTHAGEWMTPRELVDELHTCFKAFDEIIDKYNIEKIKTVGDAYLAASGLPVENPDHAVEVISAALEISEFMRQRKEELGSRTFGIRLGVNSGTVIAGIVGVKKFAYDIWGDTVNTAARMEQNSENCRVNISEHTYELVKDKFVCTYRGEIGAKNKGELKMYFVEARNKTGKS